MSNETNVGTDYNTYMLTVSDSFSIFDRCKVYVDSLGGEAPFIQVGVYANAYGNVERGLDAFKSTNPSPLVLKLLNIFSLSQPVIQTGIVELVPSNPEADCVIDEGQNIVVVTSLNGQVSLLGHNKGFNPMNGMFLQGGQAALSEDISEKLSEASEAYTVPSVQFYKKSSNAPSGPEQSGPEQSGPEQPPLEG